MSGFKNRRFADRFRFALAGIAAVARRERSFRAQLLAAAGALLLTASIRPGWYWAAAIAVSIALVLALEMVNAALEYALDHLHSEFAPEVGLAKDAAAGAVLLASLAACCVGAAMIASTFA